MTKTFTITFTAAFLLNAFLLFPVYAKQLIEDPHFQQGFSVIAPKHGDATRQGNIGVRPGAEPVWRLAQWYSKYSIATAKPQQLPSGAVRYENETKSVTIGPPSTDESDLTLAVDSRLEYGNACSTKVENWPHLLVEQPIHRSASIAQMRSLRLHLETRLLYDERFKLENFNPDMHTAQVPYVLVVQNTNQKSSGYGDFFWFLVPLYDSRHCPELPLYIAEDTADPTSKLIYNPGSKAYGDYNLHDKKWHIIDVDLLPFLKKAFQEAWKRGYLQGSKDMADYRVVSMNLGWEVTGVNRAAIQFKNLSLEMITK